MKYQRQRRSLPAAVRVELLAPQCALQIRHPPRRRPCGAWQRQCPQPEGRHRRRRPALPDLTPTIRPPGAADYKSLVRLPIATARVVRLTDAGRGASISAENLRNLGLAKRQAVGHDDRRNRQPGANIIGMARSRQGADAATAGIAGLARDRRQPPRSICSTTIRAPLWDVETTPIIIAAVIPVILVVFALLRSARATLVLQCAGRYP